MKFDKHKWTSSSSSSIFTFFFMFLVTKKTKFKTINNVRHWLNHIFTKRQTVKTCKIWFQPHIKKFSSGGSQQSSCSVILYKRKLQGNKLKVKFSYLPLTENYTLKESSMVFRVFSDVCHCLSLALATNKTTVFPFAVAFARLCEPVRAYGVSSTYL